MYSTKTQRRPPERRATVLIVGVGALGCAAAEVVAGAREVALTLLDPDRVELSNLQRQVLFGDADVGRLKVEAASTALHDAPASITAFAERLDEGNARSWITRHDFVIDATDDPRTKRLINEIAVAARKRFCYGGVLQTGGVALSVAPGLSPCLECVFAAPAHETDPEGCDRAGILAPVAGVVGALQGREALGALGLQGAWHPGRLTVYEVRGRRWTFFEPPRRADCRVCRSAVASSRRIQPCHS